MCFSLFTCKRKICRRVETMKGRSRTDLLYKVKETKVVNCKGTPVLRHQTLKQQLVNVKTAQTLLTCSLSHSFLSLLSFCLTEWEVLELRRLMTSGRGRNLPTSNSEGPAVWVVVIYWECASSHHYHISITIFKGVSSWGPEFLLQNSVCWRWEMWVADSFYPTRCRPGVKSL